MNQGYNEEAAELAKKSKAHYKNKKDKFKIENNTPIKGLNSSIKIKNLDWYDKYIDGYGLYDKIRNKIDHND